MLVYGDPSEEVALPALAARVAACADARLALVRAGELEQAVADHLPEAEARVAAVTDRAAAALLAGAPPPPSALDLPDVRVRVKVPEGFAFYALFPEQYVEATRAWLADHTTPGRALVVGVRTIGTALSAVVAATLAATGWRVRRLTVRPTGHPFDRRAEFGALPEVDEALVVDEGPGLSGSSMAAVARALAAAGVARVAFLPGHAGEPGGAASDDVRAWWARTPRYVAEPRWGGRTLPEILAERTGEATGVHDVGAGRWRAVLWPDVDAWPAAFPRFEAPKYRCARRDGSAILWKFAGLRDPEAVAGRLRARAPWTPAPVDAAYGFVALPWVEGTPLTRADSAGHLAAYIAHASAAAGPPLASDEAEAAFERLREMLRVNAGEALGPEAEARARALADTYRPAPGPRAGDGRLAPHEWVRTASGRLVKTDAAGHDADHTLVGPQPVAWDVAGALAEWGLPDGALPGATAFHRAAHAAFRLGMCAVCADDEVERPRLERAAASYRADLVRLLRGA